jgi:hypothetical protein
VPKITGGFQRKALMGPCKKPKEQAKTHARRNLTKKLISLKTAAIPLNRVSKRAER